MVLLGLGSRSTTDQDDALHIHALPGDLVDAVGHRGQQAFHGRTSDVRGVEVRIVIPCRAPAARGRFGERSPSNWGMRTRPSAPAGADRASRSNSSKSRLSISATAASKGAPLRVHTSGSWRPVASAKPATRPSASRGATCPTALTTPDVPNDTTQSPAPAPNPSAAEALSPAPGPRAVPRGVMPAESRGLSTRGKGAGNTLLCAVDVVIGGVVVATIANRTGPAEPVVLHRLPGHRWRAPARGERGCDIPQAALVHVPWMSRRRQASHPPIRRNASSMSPVGPANDNRTCAPPRTVSKSTPGAIATPVSANNFEQKSSESVVRCETSA